MTVTSMTGFASVNVMLPLPDGGQSQMSINLKTLNSKFFEANCKLPHALNSLEPDLISLFKSSFKRGNIYFSLYMSNSGAITRKIQPALTVIEQYLNAVKLIQEKKHIPGTLNIDNLINLPDVFESQDSQLEPVTMQALMEKIDEVVKAVQKSRKVEGDNLAQDLQNRINKIEGHFLELEPRSKEVKDKRKEELLKNFQAIQALDSEQTQEAQNSYIYSQLDKLDIHEEIVRFSSHLKNLKQILTNNEFEKGKKIDFTLQELFREINTIAAKSPDAIISTIVINIKVELEKSREQAQNIV